MTSPSADPMSPPASPSAPALLRAELRKALGLPGVWISLAVGVIVPPLLTVLNGRGAARELDAGRLHDAASQIGIVGQAELLLAIVAAGALGVLLVGSEYRRIPAERGGGAQATTSALAVPRRSSLLAAKVGALLSLVAAMTAVAVPACLLLARHVTGRWAVPLDAARWGYGATSLVYLALIALLAMGVTLMTRQGIVPLLLVVANFTTASPSYLLTKITSWAWYLPDLAGASLLSSGGFPEALDRLPGGLVLAAWTLATFGAGAALHLRRDT